MLVAAGLMPLSGLAAEHPMDPLSAAEIEQTAAAVKASGKAGARPKFAFIRLYEPPKASVRAWSPGESLPARKAEAYAILAGKLFRAIVDLKSGEIESWDSIDEGQPPFETVDFLLCNSLVKQDEAWQAAIRKRGIENPDKVVNLPYSTGFYGDESERGRRLFRVGSYYPEDTTNYWGRPIGGLSALVDLTNRRVVEVIDRGAVPLPKENVEYESDKLDDLITPPSEVRYQQPGGAGYSIDGHFIHWDRWSFHYRVEGHAGLVLSNITFDDGGKARDVLYQASLSELFVPYMDPNPGWYYKTFIDAGEYGMGNMLTAIMAGQDCPGNATLLDVVLPGVTGRPLTFEKVVAVFERYAGNPVWRHVDALSGQSESRRDQELVVRTIGTIGNYDYLFDWVLRTDGEIRVDVGATGICSSKAVASRDASEDPDRMDGRFGRFIADHTVAVNHDHFVIYRLDFDVDGPTNRFVKNPLRKVRFAEDSPRTSGWVVDQQLVETESDAQLRMNQMEPALWRVVSTTNKNKWGNPTSYMIRAGHNAISLMDADDWSQRRGAFSANNFYVTPYRPEERHAAGDFPNQSDGRSGLSTWVAQNRSIKDRDIVAWYCVGLHHVVRAEDWPIMPTTWHSFSLAPFDFFDRNPAQNLRPDTRKKDGP